MLSIFKAVGIFLQIFAHGISGFSKSYIKDSRDNFISNTADLDSATSPVMTSFYQTAEKPASKHLPPDRLQPKQVVQFSTSPSKSAKYTVRVNLTQKKQELMGFGGAFTDSVAHVFSQLNASLQEKVIDLLWGPDGQNYTLARLTIGSTDFSTTVYNYNEKANDFNQTNFTIAHDKEQIIPMIKRAIAANDKLSFISTSWSPPGWMKKGWLTKKGYMRNSAKPGMIDDPKMYKSYALYLSKYISAYKAAGVPISMMTIQNEPDSADHMFPVAYPACNFNGTGEGEFLRDYLGPQMRADHPDIDIFIHDGQKFHDVPILDRVNAILQAAGSKEYIHGVAFHWYGNNLKNYQFLQELRDAHPDLVLLGTEATLEAPSAQHITSTPWKEGQKYAVDIIGDLNAGASGWIEWNVLLDSTGGPTCIGATTDDTCTPDAGHCDAPILANIKKQTIEIRDSYWHMGHFSRFIPRGSTVLGVQGATNTNTSFACTAAQTPASETVVVCVNRDDSGT